MRNRPTGSLSPASAFSDSADRELVWETLRSHPDEARSESALQALDRIFDRADDAWEEGNEHATEYLRNGGTFR